MNKMHTIQDVKQRIHELIQKEIVKCNKEIEEFEHKIRDNAIAYGGGGWCTQFEKAKKRREDFIEELQGLERAQGTAVILDEISIYSYWYGIKTGLTAAIAYGVLQLLLDPYILNIPQVLLDYILGFGALGLSGIFSKSKHGLVKGYIIGVIGRFICSFLSGWIFFAVYTPDFFNSAILYSVVYNGSYIGLEAVVTLVVISLPPVNKALAYVKNNLV